MKTARLEPRYLEFVPRVLEPGVLYISEKYTTAAHLCCCGCGQKVVTPLRKTEWTLVKRAQGVSLYPSIGNWGFPCRSHYIIRDNCVIWAGNMSTEQIQRNRKADQRRTEQYFGRTGLTGDDSLLDRFVRWWRL